MKTDVGDRLYFTNKNLPVNIGGLVAISTGKYCKIGGAITNKYKLLYKNQYAKNFNMDLQKFI